MSNAGANPFDCGDAYAGAPRGAARLATLVRGALPQRCELCAASTDGGILCRECAASLPRVEAACPVCALPSAQSAICGACLREPPEFAATLAAFLYVFPVDRLIQAVKYGGRTALAQWAGATLAATVQAAFAQRRRGERPQRIVAIPLSAARQRQRGFNQAGLIATHVARATALPVASPIARIAGALPQTGLPWRERRRNVRGAFAVHGDVRGARIALVDDVMTTGATLGEAARALGRAGAARVECWVVARTPPPEPR